MKQRLFLFVVTLSAGMLSAFAREPEAVFLNAGNVEHINIRSDMDIVLIQASADENSFILDQKTSENLNLLLDNNTLSISEKETNSKQKTVIYLYVNKLKTLSVEGNTQVQTFGTLNTDKLDVFVDGYSQVHLRTTGSIQAHSLNDSEIKVKYLSGNPLAKRGF